MYICIYTYKMYIKYVYIYIRIFFPIKQAIESEAYLTVQKMV